ncbi:MAG TPA: hypothetical protein VEK35_11160 [Roseiarcus sp.]|nr:hypothetical protein [Roseiarcus sp.]
MAQYPKSIVITALVCATQLSPGPGHAQQGKQTRIHAVFQNYYERIRPGYKAGIVTEDLSLVLSGANDVREDFTSSNALATQSWNKDTKLGGSIWRVDGPHKIVGTQRMPQSIRTVTIEVNGTNCNALWEQNLLPGFSEYYFFSIVLRQYAYYKQARMISSTCEISSS